MVLTVRLTCRASASHEPCVCGLTNVRAVLAWEVSESTRRLERVDGMERRQLCKIIQLNFLLDQCTTQEPGGRGVSRR